MRPIILLSIALLLAGCADYQKSVDSRSIGVSGQTDGTNAGGKVVYTVRYR